MINKSPNIKKHGQGLFGNIYSYNNFMQYRPRYYSLSDSEQGLDSLSRELLVRWSREAAAQLPFVDAAIRIKAQFAVGNSYDLEYRGENTKWGKMATDWWKQSFAPNPTTKGYLSFKELLYLISITADTDGDILSVYGVDRDGSPKIQYIPTHRVRSFSYDGGTYTEGPMPGTILADGVVYDKAGKPLGYNVVNYDNLVNQVLQTTENKFVSAKNSHLIFDPRFLDKGRGRPAIGSAILQALSIQEIDTYLMEKIKLSSMLGWIEKTPSGEGPMELQTTADAFNANASAFGVFAPAPNTHGVEIVQGVTNRFIKAEGGDIKMMDSNTPQDETKNYITRLEQQVLSVIGVPHQLVYSQDTVSGRVSDGVAKIFIAGIERQQAMLDKHAKFVAAWAINKAIANGELPENDDEDFSAAFQFSHPPSFSLNDGYDHKADMDDLKAGVKTLNDITIKRGKTAAEVMEEQEKETKDLLVRAQRISKETGTDIQIVVQLLRNSVTQFPQVNINTPTNNEK